MMSANTPPREPTEEMLKAAREAEHEQGGRSANDFNRVAWRAMWDAWYKHQPPAPPTVALTCGKGPGKCPFWCWGYECLEPAAAESPAPPQEIANAELPNVQTEQDSVPQKSIEWWRAQTTFSRDSWHYYEDRAKKAEALAKSQQEEIARFKQCHVESEQQLREWQDRAAVAEVALAAVTKDRDLCRKHSASWVRYGQANDATVKAQAERIHNQRAEIVRLESASTAVAPDSLRRAKEE